jgi:hypothetical protein
MRRLIWRAIFCLVGIGGLFAVRSAVGLSAIGRAAPEATPADETDFATPLAKGDRLPPPRMVDDNPIPKTAVETVKIVPPDPPKQQDRSKDGIVSWHWHEGSKIVRRRTP